MTKNKQITVLDKPITLISIDNEDYISLTDMLKAKDGDFFISDWLRNRNTIEFLGIWERVHNENFNYGEYAIIRSQAGLNSYKISVKEWVKKKLMNSENLFVRISIISFIETGLFNIECPVLGRIYGKFPYSAIFRIR
ncbi:MAG: KilA-N domain-containing protein [Candidatus Cloacimonetes bacterium]|nr:KilA-N domain-containing protein [Candidatus Cloacimonadota bacterium]